MKFNVNLARIEVSLPSHWIEKPRLWLERRLGLITMLLTLIISLTSLVYYMGHGHHLAYNDAMSHLDIARRVTDNLTPGMAQLGSVWLPLLHVLMLPTIWIDSMWHSGLSAALISMLAYLAITWFTYRITHRLTKNSLAATLAALTISLNTNLIYLQTTALTEPLFMALFSAGMYYLVAWVQENKLINLIRTALMITLASLTRYDGWATLGLTSLFVSFATLLKYKKWSAIEGVSVLFVTLASLGAILWFGWNLIIFGDPLYFATGEFSAKAQQDVLAASDNLETKGNVLLSMSTYYYAAVGNVGVLIVFVGVIGWFYYMWQARTWLLKALGLVFLAPLAFNILALYLGHSVIHLPQTVGQTWFNVRYGLLVLPWLAIFIGYLSTHKNLITRFAVSLTVMLQILLFFSSHYTITLDDGLWGSSQKNVKGIGRWINTNINQEDEYILVSVASHDAILFASRLPMSRFIHEGTGIYWKESLQSPEDYARYVIMRTHDELDLVARAVDELPDFFDKYELIYDDEFADIYQLKAEYNGQSLVVQTL